MNGIKVQTLKYRYSFNRTFYCCTFNMWSKLLKMPSFFLYKSMKIRKAITQWVHTTHFHGPNLFGISIKFLKPP